MILADVVGQKKEALRVEDVARILDISAKQIYKMAAKGQIPSFKIANCVRFDPHDVAAWLRGQSCPNPSAAISLQSRAYPTRRNARLLNHARLIDPPSPQLSIRRRGGDCELNPSLVKLPGLLLGLRLADAEFDRVCGPRESVHVFEEFLWTNVGGIW